MQGRNKTYLICIFVFEAIGVFCMFFMCSIRISGKETDDIPPDIKVEITDEDKKYTNRERTAYIVITDDCFKNEITKEYRFKEGEDSLFFTVKDTSGNESSYRSETFIQDYTVPEVKIEGITDNENINEYPLIKINFEEEWPDAEKSYVLIRGRNTSDEYLYSFNQNEKKMVIDNTAVFSDDYYTLVYSLWDKAGNKTEGCMDFTININGSRFEIDEKNRSAIGTTLNEIKDFTISEYNLSKTVPGDIKILFTHNGKIYNLEKGRDYYTEEKTGRSGYIYTYKFDDGIFKKDGVYTISISDKDEAGNTNDTRFDKDTDEIRFAVKKESKKIEENLGETHKEMKGYVFLAVSLTCVLIALVSNLFKKADSMQIIKAVI